MPICSPTAWSAVTRTSVDWPGEIMSTVVLNGFTYSPSAATTLIVWFAILKKKLVLIDPLTIRNKYVFPGTNLKVKLSAQHSVRPRNYLHQNDQQVAVRDTLRIY